MSILSINDNMQNVNIEKNNTVGDGLVYKEDLRHRRYGLQRKMQDIVEKMTTPSEFKSCRVCGKKLNNGSGSVKVYKSREYGKAFYGGLMMCSSVWACPVCSAKIQNRRAQEVERVLKAHVENGGQLVMVSYTHAHHAGQGLAGNIEKHNDAMRKLKSGKSYKSFKDDYGIIGTIQGNEVTYGLNGWHWHNHAILLLEKSVKIDEMQAYLSRRWLSSCKRAGFVFTDEHAEADFLKYSVNVSSVGVNAYRYPCKSGSQWGIGKEITRSAEKGGRGFGRTPFELLESDDERNAELFVEYIRATRGRAQLVWSRGLKSLFGIEEKTDEEINEEQEDTAEVIAELSPEAWRCVIGNHAEADILIIAENEGFNGLEQWFADYGMTLQPPRLE